MLRISCTVLLSCFSIGAVAQSVGGAVAQSAGSAAPSLPAAVASPNPAATPLAVAPVSAPSSSPSAEKVEKIEVTGSHIKRLDTEGVSPVETITRKELEKSGYNSVADVMRDMSANSFGSTREASGSNAAGNAEIDLRGLGSQNTLVLLNGHRLPADAVTGAVDLNLIPMAAVERIEILKDGASAIYGSDALGGVVNIITRKDFSGNEVSATMSVPEMKGGGKREISLVNGINGSRYNIVNVIQYRNNDPIYSRDRSWSNSGTSNYGSPGSYRNSGGTWHADPNCPASQITHTADGDFCNFKYSDYSTELPALQQLSAMSEAHYELNSNVHFTARLGATNKKVQWSFAPAPDSFTIPGSVADHLGSGGGALPGASAGQDLEARYRLTELGTRDTQVNTNAYNALLGTTIQLSDSWSLDISLSHNIVLGSDWGVNGYALKSAVASDVSAGSFNPFGTPGSRGSLDNAKYYPLEETMSQMSAIEVEASGEIAQMESGPVSLALGSDLNFQKYSDSFDAQSLAGNVYGNAGSNGAGSREVTSAFSEFSVPLTKKLELQIAGRFDHYSDFGSTTNPKLAFLYHLNPQWLLRGSVGTGFRAPSLPDMYASSSSGQPTFIDWVSCQRERNAGIAATSCDPAQYPVTSSGNPGLQPEKSLSYSAGAVYEPNSNFNIGTDFFLTKLSNVVGIDYSDAMLAEANGVNLAQYGVVVNRDKNGYIDNIVAPSQNLSSQEIAGVDLSGGYRVRRLHFTENFSKLFYFKEEGFPGVGLRNKLGENGKPGWRNNAGLEYTIDEKSNASLIAMTTAGQAMSVQDSGSLPDYTEFDLNYSYKTKSDGTFGVGIKNVLGTTPPLDNSSPTAELNTEIYDQIGRQFVANYKRQF